MPRSLAALRHAWRQAAVGAGVIVERQRELLELVGTIQTSRGGPRGLNGWEEQRHQDADDGDHYQQFDQGEAWPGL
jgi:hypothetical protein